MRKCETGSILVEQRDNNAAIDERQNGEEERADRINDKKNCVIFIHVLLNTTVFFFSASPKFNGDGPIHDSIHSDNFN